MLSEQWDTYGDQIPMPTLLDLNDGATPSQRVDLSRSDYVIIKAGLPGETEMYRDGWHYLDRNNKMEVEIHTKHSRQRLYDLKREIRRIIHNRVHSLDDYQVIRYVDFNEQVDTQLNVWQGRVTLTLENNRISMET